MDTKVPSSKFHMFHANSYSVSDFSSFRVLNFEFEYFRNLWSVDCSEAEAYSYYFWFCIRAMNVMGITGFLCATYYLCSIKVFPARKINAQSSWTNFIWCLLFTFNTFNGFADGQQNKSMTNFTRVLSEHFLNISKCWFSYYYFIIPFFLLFLFHFVVFHFGLWGLLANGI